MNLTKKQNNERPLAYVLTYNNTNSEQFTEMKKNQKQFDYNNSIKNICLSQEKSLKANHNQKTWNIQRIESQNSKIKIEDYVI